MKIYRPGDRIGPVAVDLRTVKEPEVGPWITAVVLIAFGFMPWFMPDTRSGLTLSTAPILAGWTLALTLAGVSSLSQRIPALARFGTRHRVAIFLGLVAAIVLTFGPLALTILVPGGRPLGMLILLAFAINFAVIPLWLVQRRNARRIAAEMHKAVQISAAMAAAAANPSSARATPGELILELYERSELPEAAPLRPITRGSNVVGQQPCHFLYLYNFFANAISTHTRPLAAWRLHGPVTMLASPIELARIAGYRLDVAHSVEARLLTDDAKISARIAEMSGLPQPPQPLSWLQRSIIRWKKKIGLKPRLALPEPFIDFGAYAEDVLLCTDRTWQAGVEALTLCADKVVMDASDFSAERHGLIWEIQHVVDRFATGDFVVLVNSFTDLPALGDAFRSAWQKMAATSPNNRPVEAHLRIVLLIGDDRGGFDDDSVLGGRSEEIRDAERIAAHHRIVALLRGADTPA